MASTTGSVVTKEQVVNDVVVLDYSAEEYASYLKAAKEYYRQPPEISNALAGLRIMDLSVSCPSTMTRSPVETGVQIADCKVRMPTTITIKGICDNIRGELQYNKKFVNDMSNRMGGKLAGAAYAVVDAATGYEFDVKQRIETRARAVYKKIHKMYTDKTRVGSYGERPKTWTISTKGAVYPNMILKDVDQLNDWEHLMVVPVTLHFEELMMVGDDASNNVFLADDDYPLSMGGAMKKGSIFEDPMGNLKSAFTFVW